MRPLICVTFSLPPGVRVWLRLLVAFSGLFCLPFFVLLASASNTYIGSILFWASAVTGAKLASEVHRTFRSLVEYSFVLLN